MGAPASSEKNRGLVVVEGEKLILFFFFYFHSLTGDSLDKKNVTYACLLWFVDTVFRRVSALYVKYHYVLRGTEKDICNS